MSSRIALSIGTLATRANVGVETIRFYQRRGLLAVPLRPPRGVRTYNEDAVGRVQFIKSAQGLGFTLDEVADLLRLAHGTRCTEARRIAESRLATIRSRLSDMRRMAAALERAIADCERGHGRVACPPIASLVVPPDTLSTSSTRRGPQRAPR